MSALMDCQVSFHGFLTFLCPPPPSEDNCGRFSFSDFVTESGSVLGDLVVGMVVVVVVVVSGMVLRNSCVSSIANA